MIDQNKIEKMGFWIELPLVLVVTSFWGLVMYETVMMLEHPLLYDLSFALLTVLWLCCIVILYKRYKRNFKGASGSRPIRSPLINQFIIFIPFSDNSCYSHLKLFCTHLWQYFLNIRK